MWGNSFERERSGSRVDTCIVGPCCPCVWTGVHGVLYTCGLAAEDILPRVQCLSSYRALPPERGCTPTHPPTHQRARASLNGDLVTAPGLAPSAIRTPCYATYLTPSSHRRLRSTHSLTHSPPASLLARPSVARLTHPTPLPSITLPANQAAQRRTSLPAPPRAQRQALLQADEEMSSARCIVGSKVGLGSELSAKPCCRCPPPAASSAARAPSPRA